MKRAVSNTSPLCYLILIDEIRILPELFTEIVIPTAVRRELAHRDAPEEVRGWIAKLPEGRSRATMTSPRWHRLGGHPHRNARTGIAMSVESDTKQMLRAARNLGLKGPGPLEMEGASMPTDRRPS